MLVPMPKPQTQSLQHKIGSQVHGQGRSLGAFPECDVSDRFVERKSERVLVLCCEHCRSKLENLSLIHI